MKGYNGLLLRHDLEEDPCFIQAQGLLGVGPDILVAKLRRLWRLADLQSDDGWIRNLSPALVDCYVELPGFADALVAAGWLEVEPDGVRIPNFAKHFREVQVTRKKTAGRKPGPPILNDDPVVTLPTVLDTPEFVAAWADFLAHRRAIKKPMTLSAQEYQLKRLAGWGLKRAVAAIHYSMANGWRGIFEEIGPPGGTSVPAPPADKVVEEALERKRRRAQERDTP